MSITRIWCTSSCNWSLDDSARHVGQVPHQLLQAPHHVEHREDCRSTRLDPLPAVAGEGDLSHALAGTEAIIRGAPPIARTAQAVVDTTGPLAHQMRAGHPGRLVGCELCRGAERKRHTTKGGTAGAVGTHRVLRLELGLPLRSQMKSRDVGAEPLTLASSRQGLRMMRGTPSGAKRSVTTRKPYLSSPVLVRSQECALPNRLFWAAEEQAAASWGSCDWTGPCQGVTKVGNSLELGVRKHIEGS